MAASGRRMNLDMGLEVALTTPYLAVPSPQALSPVVMSIPEREVLAVKDLVPAVEDVQARAAFVRAPVVGVIIDCWSQTWVMKFQKSRRSTLSQPLLYPLNFRLNNNNNGGSLLKRRKRGCTRVP